MKVVIALLIMTSFAHAETCTASYYTTAIGTRTASGIPLQNNLLTAAHNPRLPWGTMLNVTNLHNGRSVRVRVTDYGPFVRGRCIDLTLAGARAIGCGGTCRVSVY